MNMGEDGFLIIPKYARANDSHEPPAKMPQNLLHTPQENGKNPNY